MIDNHIERTDLALTLLSHVRALLEDGRRWRPGKAAANRLGLSCDPLARSAYYFSLMGAVERAKAEMEGELEQAWGGEAAIRDVMKALASAGDPPATGQRGWLFIDSVLLGLETALIEYEEEFNCEDRKLA